MSHDFSVSSDVNSDCCTNCSASSVDTLCHTVTNLNISTDCTDNTYCKYPLLFSHLLPQIVLFTEWSKNPKILDKIFERFRLIFLDFYVLPKFLHCLYICRKYGTRFL